MEAGIIGEVPIRSGAGLKSETLLVRGRRHFAPWLCSCRAGTEREEKGSGRKRFREGDVRMRRVSLGWSFAAWQ